ncbi:hypothetical protein BASA50_004802 [Batrachochytrium salamandrivorans]|uniref:Uncharacterized protein n=1 Tax=Batrachochytrium salamandrivorans TaxID=1357716 RepID=A0ABQ8FET6_9FUNG|nr:hypothetical protein BASA50_004802 [Batrachochytrium salamandrivorans]
MDTIGDSEQQSASRTLAKAMHRQAVPFSFFAHPLWKEFFTTIRPTFRLPPPDVLNVMACDSAAIFIEHFCMDLSSESAANLLVKLTSIKDCLIVALYPPCNRDNDVPDPAIAAADLL